MYSPPNFFLEVIVPTHLKNEVAAGEDQVDVMGIGCYEERSFLYFHLALFESQAKSVQLRIPLSYMVIYADLEMLRMNGPAAGSRWNSADRTLLPSG